MTFGRISMWAAAGLFVFAIGAAHAVSGDEVFTGASLPAQAVQATAASRALGKSAVRLQADARRSANAPAARANRIMWPAAKKVYDESMRDAKETCVMITVAGQYYSLEKPRCDKSKELSSVYTWSLFGGWGRVKSRGMVHCWNQWEGQRTGKQIMITPDHYYCEFNEVVE